MQDVREHDRITHPADRSETVRNTEGMELLAQLQHAPDFGIEWLLDRLDRSFGGTR